MAILTTISKYVDIAGPLLGILLCLYWNKGKQKAGGYLIVISYLLLQLIANSIAKYMSIHRINNITVYKFNALLSLLIVSVWFYHEFKQRLSSKKLYLLAIYMIGIHCLSGMIIYFEDTTGLNSLSLSFTAFNACLFCGIFYITSLTKLNDSNLFQSTQFWITTAFFLYYSTCFCIYVSFKIITKKSGGNFMYLWIIQNYFLFISCCILGFSFKNIKKWSM